MRGIVRSLGGGMRRVVVIAGIGLVVLGVGACGKQVKVEISDAVMRGEIAGFFRDAQRLESQFPEQVKHCKVLNDCAQEPERSHYGLALIHIVMKSALLDGTFSDAESKLLKETESVSMRNKGITLDGLYDMMDLDPAFNDAVDAVEWCY